MKNLIITFITTILTLLICVMCCCAGTIGATVFLLTPRTYYTTATADSSNSNYHIEVKYADYGGSSGSCFIGYMQGSAFYTYHFGKMCGGITTHSFLINNSNPFEIHELAFEPLAAKCGTEGGPCATITIERLADFELLPGNYVHWYGSRVHYK